MASSFSTDMNYVNYREFEDFRQETRDSFDTVTENINEKFAVLGDQMDSIKNEIQSLQIDQLKFQLNQTKEKMNEEILENTDDKNYRRALTIAIAAAMIGPLVGAVVGIVLGYLIP